MHNIKLNEDFNFNDFSKKISNKDIVKIIKENNRQNYIIEKFDIEAKVLDIFGHIIPSRHNFNKIGSIQYKNNIYYSGDFDNLVFEPNEEIRINLKDDIIDYNSLFYACEKIKELNLSHFDTSKVTDMSYMFYNCEGLKKLDLSSFNTSKVTDMSNMFASCHTLKSLNLSSFDTSNVTDMSDMFRYCASLKELDLSSFDISNVTDMSYMFAFCYNLKSLNLNSFDIHKGIEIDNIFLNCKNLKI